MTPMSLVLLKNTIFAFTDIETTGLDPFRGDKICEIAVLRSRYKQKIASFHSLIDPGRNISPAAYAVNGITEEMLIGKPKFAEVATEILDVLHKAVIVCHNAPFDIGFLESEINLMGLTIPEFPVIDTLIISRRYFNFQGNNLNSVARCLGVKIDQQHRAMSDVITTEKIFWELIKDLQRRGGVNTLADVFSLCKK
ncbi:3'-5' exonuclease [candidate division NPL-UPA2 bacterium Unc8]|uniref:3'-5' exonuclease n=1 Tax=candidate division NPL-UPA2 bacterium Unc8 TaxID=1980939 RepID=A0A399FVW0_UNCN2|nr:DNA polymerase III subunit epsilon [Bacillota bacterium]RII00558.1 MAG: 3'-5' exonuclease [candidate division NPL-UPA2 bacterium Unc8]